MPGDNPTIIAERSAARGRRALLWAVGVTALGIGAAAAVHYARLGLTLSHYDARAHLVVARRITDSLTPGWRQIGAVWLPLPHLLDAGPVLSDWGYRTGYLVAAMSVVSLAAGLVALAAWVHRRTGSAVAAAAAPGIILTNPSLLYLQSTPMTEPLLLGLSFVSLLAVDRSIEQPSRTRLWQAGLALMALALTRYEGWCVAGVLAGTAGLLRMREGVKAALLLPAFVAAAIAAFMLLGWASTGSVFVTGGFFVPDNPAFHAPMTALEQVVEGIVALGGRRVLTVGMVGTLIIVWAAVRADRTVLVASLLSAAALPLYAFFEGHPYRVRYMVPVVAAAGVLAAMVIARLPRATRAIAAVALVVACAFERPPLDDQAPMVLEAQWETPFRLQREVVTKYLAAAHDGTPVLASMGSLGHYMQEASRAGFALKTFLHEGNGDLWSAAVVAPARYVNWVLVEERAEGGDELAGRAKRDSRLLEGFTRVAEGGGLVLYRKTCQVQATGCGAHDPLVRP